MRLIVKFNIVFLAIFLVGLAIAAYVSLDLLRQNARDEVLQHARIMMESALATRGYTSKQVRPLLETQMKYQFLPQSVPAFAASEQFSDLRKKFAAIEEELTQVSAKSTEDFANFPTKLDSKFGYLQNVTDSADTAPTAAELAVFADLDQRLETQLTKWGDVLSKDVPALNDAMNKHNIPLVAPSATPAK